MCEIKYFDIIYIGVGISTVTHYLKHKESFKNKKICFIEKEKRINQNKTIAGFTKEIDLPILKKFNLFECRFEGDSKVYKTNTPYYVLDLDRIFNQFFEASKEHDFLFNTHIGEISKDPSLFIISTPQGQLQADKIFDARPPRISNKCFLKQHFLGWYVNFESDHHLNAPILMDIDDKQSNFCFTYVLPMDKKTVLIEITYYSENVFSPEYYERYIHDYISKNFPQNGFVVQKKETGSIPLINIKPIIDIRGYECLGIRGGHLRASTGYSVISSTKEIRPTRLMRLLDSYLLKVLWRSPKLGNFIFIHFLKNINGSTMANFMSEKPGILNLLNAAKAMPLSVFLSHLIKSKNGLITTTTIKGFND